MYNEYLFTKFQVLFLIHFSQFNGRKPTFEELNIKGTSSFINQYSIFIITFRIRLSDTNVFSEYSRFLTASMVGINNLVIGILLTSNC